MAKHYERLTTDAESRVSDTNVITTEVSDTTIYKKASVVKKSEPKSGINVIYKDGKVISSEPF